MMNNSDQNFWSELFFCIFLNFAHIELIVKTYLEYKITLILSYLIIKLLKFIIYVLWYSFWCQQN